jgi:hypothetical protein
MEVVLPLLASSRRWRIGSVACIFLGMGTMAYTLQKMGILVYTFLENEMVIWLVNMCVK